GAFWPEDLSATVRRRLREVGGLALIAGAALVTVALGTWSVRDPSLSYATGGPVRNLLGRGGAASADLLMQLLGIASIALLLPIAVWGWRMVTHRRLDRLRLRLALWLAGTVLTAGFIACLPPPATRPPPPRVGGGVGGSIPRAPAPVAGAGPAGLARL